ncbi:hypothetical protein H8356DRAFT_1383907 [Neocallimastix lanati (nom. inval.)]|uniref:Uncharacterized protein n=1 Tax=Neocallimastix californiae TaxID=1754190 RepID=A0A1Y2FJB8_9FUNG|nr:hypothetical protein H8356DRAFT_1383907 [Neocallimastix sp. JGI-2020a]ORY84061.1 hypothetical protein LY90DRAFT_499501 [Neocallimastix californiae]|eukprot:ORY84061.1 hypothetical protein LY90DRAFT_499501 [Neocallimastix californiae]
MEPVPFEFCSHHISVSLILESSLLLCSMLLGKYFRFRTLRNVYRNHRGGLSSRRRHSRSSKRLMKFWMVFPRATSPSIIHFQLKQLTILENDSRYCILPDRPFPFIYENINGIEKAIKEYEGVEKVTIDLKYISNVYKIIAHVYGIDESNKAVIIKFLKSKLKSQLIPAENIIFHN